MNVRKAPVAKDIWYAVVRPLCFHKEASADSARGLLSASRSKVVKRRSHPSASFSVC